jgi:hypothetical protein
MTVTAKFFQISKRYSFKGRSTNLHVYRRRKSRSLHLAAGFHANGRGYMPRIVAITIVERAAGAQ